MSTGQTCLSYHNNKLPEYSVYSLANPIAFGFLLLIRVWIYYLETVDKPNPKNASPSYGIGALAMLKFLLGLGMANSFASTILFFIFFNSPGSNSLEFACQAQSGYIGVIFPFLFIFLVLLILVTNYLRVIWVRYKLAQYTTASLVPANANQKHCRIAMLPTARGNWIPPLARQFATGAGPDKVVEIICFDAYNSKYNTEGSEWLKANMEIEGIKGYHIVSTDFARLPVGDNLIDVIVMPTGNVLPYLTEPDSQDKAKERLAAFLQEVHRVLKPGGRLITSNLMVMQSSFVNGLKESPFAEFNTQSQWLFWTYIPATITVATKATGTGNDEEKAGEPGSMSDNGEIDLELAEVMTQSSSIAVSAGDITGYGWFPRGWHWRLVEALIVFTLGLWAIYVVMTWYLVATLQVPTFLPYNQKVTSLFISNATTLPFVIYWILGRLRKAAIEVETDMRNERNKVREGSVSGDYQGFESIALEEAFYSNLAVRRILRCYRSELVDVVLLLTLNSGLGWFPTFIVDYILIKDAGVSVNNVGNANTIVSIVVTYLFLVAVRRLYGYYDKFKKRQEEELTQAATADVVTETVRHSMAVRESRASKMTELSAGVTSNPISPLEQNSPY